MLDWAAVATAVGTFSLAGVGTATWRQNRSLIKVASDEAFASNLLVAETVRDRELRWQPWPSVRWVDSVVGSGGNHDIELTNAGVGPAISCRLVIMQDGQDGFLTPAVDIPPSATVVVRADQVLDPSVSYPLSTWKDDDNFNHNAEALGAIFTKDVLGYRYRFLIVKDGSSRAIIERRERWRLGEDPEPSWAGYRVIWPDYGIQNS
jgi:hypothetical protein